MALPALSVDLVEEGAVQASALTSCPDDRALYFPRFDRPRCRVNLVCGPPGGGKSTHVATNAAPVASRPASVARRVRSRQQRPGQCREQ
jgi:hypothetical protein